MQITLECKQIHDTFVRPYLNNLNEQVEEEKEEE